MILLVLSTGPLAARTSQAAPATAPSAPAAAPAPIPASVPAPVVPVPVVPVPGPAPATVAATTPAPASRAVEAPALDRPVGRISLRSMVRGSDPVVQAVMALLLLCSAASWAVLIEKTVLLGQVRRQTRAFAASFRQAASMDEVEGLLGPATAGPARQLWMAARREWDLSLERIPRPFGPDQMSRLLQRLTLAMGVAQEGALSRLGNWMGLLATIGATAPFVGLFGTVWGILHSFAQIAATRSTSLAVVAPGIAEALLTTAVGLFAAIPATVFYNRFARQVGQITGSLDNVAAELLALASRDSERLAR